MSLFDKTTSGLGKSLDMRLVRQDVINANIANAETPGYKSQVADFESELSRALDIEGKGAMSTNHPEHFPVGQGPIGRIKPLIYDNPDIPVNNDKNTVDLEKEMAGLAENTILYRAAVELINKKLGAMKYAVTEGGK